MTSYDLNQVIKEPTRVSDTCSTLLDHIYISDGLELLEATVSQIAISDHYPVACTLGTERQNGLKGHKSITYRKKTTENTDIMNQLVKQQLTRQKPINDLNEAVTFLTNTITFNHNKFAPLMTKRVKTTNRVPWITKEIRFAMRIRDRFKVEKNTNNYKFWRNKVLNLLRNSKNLYYQEAIKYSNGKTKKLWNHINNLSKSNHKNEPQSILLDNVISIDKTVIANALNSHFVSVAPQILKDCRMDQNYMIPKDLKHYIKKTLPAVAQFNIPEVTEKYVLSQIKSLDPKKATGDDQVCVPFLQMCAPAVAPLLCSILNESINSGQYPNSWKIARVCAIFKKGCAQDVSNYRPVAILNIMSKIIERHVYQCLLDYLNQYNLLSSNQSGFRKGYSCESCLLNITNKWHNALNKGHIVGCVALDLSKAFDVLNIDIALKKLEIYQCSSTALLWFRSFLCGRKQYVKINEYSSEIKDQNHGVPQGSILSPLIFGVFMNDLPLFLKKVNIDLYADDINLYSEGVSVKKIENTLSKDIQVFEKWCYNNKLKVNIKKSKSLLICTKQRRLKLGNPELKLKLNNEHVECVKEHTILGLVVDNDLTWSSHINLLCRKLSTIIGLLWRIKDYLSYDMKIMYYNSFIVSRMDYCICIWGVFGVYLSISEIN